MRIAIDCRFAALHAGLGRYTRELVTELLRLSGNTEYILIVRSEREAWIPRDSATIVADIPHYSMAEQIALPGIIRRAAPDLLFSPHFNVPLFCPVPFVITVHDLILHRYPNHASFPRRLAYRATIGSAVRRARAIIAVSDFTASELRAAYGDQIASKTAVVTEGVSDAYVRQSPQEAARIRAAYHLDSPFLLYVGNAKQHKNLRVLIDAFTAAHPAGYQLLLVTGGAEIETITPLPPHVRRIGNVPDADMPALMTCADAVVTASLYEGFCLPVAEAIACGTPVIASNVSAIPEAAAGKAMLVAPTVEAFTDAFRSLPPSRIEPYRIGDWKSAALRTHEIFHGILQKDPARGGVRDAEK